MVAGKLHAITTHDLGSGVCRNDDWEDSHLQLQESSLAISERVCEGVRALVQDNLLDHLLASDGGLVAGMCS